MTPVTLPETNSLHLKNQWVEMMKFFLFGARLHFDRCELFFFQGGGNHPKNKLPEEKLGHFKNLGEEFPTVKIYHHNQVVTTGPEIQPIPGWFTEKKT